MSETNVIRVSRAMPKPRFLLAVLACCLIAALVFASTGNFERTYTPQGQTHLTITNADGDINLTAWQKKSLTVRAVTDPGVSIEDQVSGNDIAITVKSAPPVGKATFEVSVPAETSVSINNLKGKIDIKGVTGHIRVNSIDSHVRLANIRSQAVDVKVTTGDIFFDGALHASGSYSLQSVKGDIDVSLPAGTSFNLVARALSENINLGEFLTNLTGAIRGTKGISGTHLRGGPKLTLITYDGRVLLHKK
ncbi:MAG TPA: DUF4097 family beta strand repeat-containing protein [Blastocatellia bacterium]|nr:DUF4097 family beta strand repeat-containing protein [Blastocatellia bacterium]